MLALLDSSSSSSSAYGGVVIANDASLDRAISLTHRLTSVNAASPRVVVTSLDARYWPNLEGFRFDRILCDVPCSGDGTLRKRHVNTPDWSAAAGEALHATQVKLLWRGLGLLREGGRLVYSTCSFNPIENEAVVAAVLRRLSEAAAAEHGEAAAGIDTGTGGGGEFVLEDARVLLDSGTSNSGDGGGLSAGPALETWLLSKDATESMRPPSDDEAEWMAAELRKCVRLQPHIDNCGGFFVAVFGKKKGASSSPSPPRPAADAAADELTEQSAPRKVARFHRSREDKIGAAQMEVLSRSSTEWEEMARFYGLDETCLDGFHLLWAPGRSAKREKLYLATEGAVTLLRHHWQPMARSDKGGRRLRDRMHAVGVKAFERLKLTNMKSKAAYTCQWRPCQQALSYILPAMTRRTLAVRDEAFFASILQERGMRLDALRESGKVVGGLGACEASDGTLEAGGAVLSLVDGDSVALLASVVVVLSPGHMAVWSPKEEVVGLLALLEGGE